MKLRHKVAGVFVILLIIGASSFALVLSYTSDCQQAADVAPNLETMKAIVYRCYGSPDVLALEDIAKPVPADNEVLVRVRAASVNPYDWHELRGSPYFFRLSIGIGSPRNTRLGIDFAGTVEAVGNDVENFKPGDEVFGGAKGAFAEYLVVAEDRAIAHMSPEVTFEQAASVGIAALTALQAVRDEGRVQAGQRVLINGASGGVGTFAVQIAKAMGAEVTGVCSTRNVDMVRSIGADHIFDYTTEDYTESGNQYDVIIDMVGNQALSANRRVLTPEGALVIVGGSKGNWLGPLMRPIGAMLLSPFVDQKLGMFIAQMDAGDLAIIGDLIHEGQVTPVIDKRFRLNEVADAIRYSEEGHARGKIVIVMD